MLSAYVGDLLVAASSVEAFPTASRVNPSVMSILSPTIVPASKPPAPNPVVPSSEDCFAAVKSMVNVVALVTVADVISDNWNETPASEALASRSQFSLVQSKFAFTSAPADPRDVMLVPVSVTIPPVLL